MGNFIVNRPFIYVFGTIIDPNQNNPNENTIYAAHNASMNGTTGHGHTGAVGDGPKIGAGGIDLTANYPWTGLHSWTQNMAIASGSKLFFDGVNFLGDTFIFESAPNILDVFTGGFLALRAHLANQLVNISNGFNFGIVTTNKLFLDVSAIGGLPGNDYFINSADGTNSLFSAGNEVFRTSATGGMAFLQDVGLQSGKKLQLDSLGAGDDYWINSANGQNDLYSAGSLTLRTSAGASVNFFGDVILNPGKFLYFDGGSDNYFFLSATDQIDFVLGGGTMLRIENSGGGAQFSIGTNATPFITATYNLGAPAFLWNELFIADVDPPTANALNRNSGAKAWVRFNVTAANTATIVDSYNVSSVTATTWVATVNWNLDFANANYAVIFQSYNTSNPVSVQNILAGSLEINPDLASGYTVGIVAFGDQ